MRRKLVERGWSIFCRMTFLLMLVLWIEVASLKSNNHGASVTRQRLLKDATRGLGTVNFLAPFLLESFSPEEVVAAEGLASRLRQRDSALLKNSVFNVPPAAQVYPNFLRGRFQVEARFGGFLFPSTKIPRERLTQDVTIPGFQKCSIAATCDVGKELAVYEMSIDETTGLEDRRTTLKQQVDAYLGYEAVQEVIYDAKANPNRISIDFIDYKTVNAERIELFCNARESELLVDDDVFVCSEYIKQVTFGTGSQVGIPRQVGGNYAHFWTWRKAEGPDGNLKGNLLTAAYLDPQDSLFFEEPSKPVAVYSHVLKTSRIKQ